MDLASFTHPIRRSAAAALLGVVALGGCDRSTAELVQDLDAAREGCTEEMLAAGSEECVQMFEKYVDMGSEAIGTYIGAMRALDEALQRRPGLQFDTTGLGHAITPGLDRSDTAATRRWSVEPQIQQAPSYADDAEWRAPGAGWSDRQNPPLRRSEPTVDRPTMEPSREYEPSSYPDEDAFGERRAEPPGGPSRGPSRRSPAAPSDRQPTPASPRRGALLPPDQRLRRPWVGDEEPARQYYPEGAAPRTEDSPREVGAELDATREPYREPRRYPF